MTKYKDMFLLGLQTLQKKFDMQKKIKILACSYVIGPDRCNIKIIVRSIVTVEISRPFTSALDH